MTKLQKAITHFYAVHNHESHASGRESAGYLADALEEIREAITPSNPDGEKVDSTEESPAFEPWDCVRAKEGTHLYSVFADADLVCGHLDSDGDRKVFNPDDDSDRGAYHCDDSDLIFVRRLKARAQEPQPVFNAGEYVKDVRFNDAAFEVMQDTNGPSVQLRNLATNGPSIGLADCLYKIDKPTPFQVGDWVETHTTKRHVQITGVQYDDTGKGVAAFVNQQGKVEYIGTDRITKIDPPTPRFTFGQRVRHYETTGLFIRYFRSQIGITKEQCQFLGLTDNNIHTCYAEELSLLDELPF